MALSIVTLRMTWSLTVFCIKVERLFSAWLSKLLPGPLVISVIPFTLLTCTPAAGVAATVGTGTLADPEEVAAVDTGGLDAGVATGEGSDWCPPVLSIKLVPTLFGVLS